MANSYTSLFVHIIFSTHKRERTLFSELRERLWAYMGGIARENKIKSIAIGGTLDHAHMLLMIPSGMSVAKAVQLIKGGSSKWLHEKFVSLRKFSWQEGYGAFSVGPSQVSDLVAYIDSQEEHHRVRSFQEEYLAFLAEYGIKYDERYLWD
jgi:putative transposase